MSSFRKFTETFLSIVSFRSHKVTVYCTDTFGHFQRCLTKFLTAAASIVSGRNTMFLGTFYIFQFPIFQTASFFPSSTVVNIYRTFRPGPGAALEGGNKAMLLVSFDCSIAVPASTKLREIAVVFLFLRCGGEMFSALCSSCCQ